MNANYHRYADICGLEQKTLPWKPKVVLFKELYDEALAAHGNSFAAAYAERFQELCQAVVVDKMPMQDVGFKLTDFIYNFIDDISPRVVIGVSPPYMPSVNNLYWEDLDEKIRNINCSLRKFMKQNFDQDYQTKYFYAGMTDLSYACIKKGEGMKIKKSLEATMPLFATLYPIYFDVIERITMPCLNVGPGGKDIHKFLERVYAPDLFTRTPAMLHDAISIILDW